MEPRFVQPIELLKSDFHPQTFELNPKAMKTVQ